MTENEPKNGGARIAGAAIPAFKLYLFDVDGTLIDSADDICGAIQTALAPTARPDVPRDFLQRYIGYHLIELFRDIFPDKSDAEIDDLVVAYRTAYPLRGHSMTRAYPRVIETLAALPGLKSTATTKGTPTTRMLLERFGFLPYFDHVQGTDGFPCKPAPDIIFKSLEILQVDPADCLFIGDSAPDMEAGRRAGVKTCGVRYGYGNLEHMARWEPDYWIDDISELAC